MGNGPSESLVYRSGVHRCEARIEIDDAKGLMGCVATNSTGKKYFLPAEKVDFTVQPEDFDVNIQLLSEDRGNGREVISDVSIPFDLWDLQDGGLPIPLRLSHGVMDVSKYFNNRIQARRWFDQCYESAVSHYVPEKPGFVLHMRALPVVREPEIPPRANTSSRGLGSPADSNVSNPRAYASSTHAQTPCATLLPPPPHASPARLTPPPATPSFGAYMSPTAAFDTVTADNASPSRNEDIPTWKVDTRKEVPNGVGAEQRSAPAGRKTRRRSTREFAELQVTLNALREKMNDEVALRDKRIAELQLSNAQFEERAFTLMQNSAMAMDSQRGDTSLPQTKHMAGLEGTCDMLRRESGELKYTITQLENELKETKARTQQEIDRLQQHVAEKDQELLMLENSCNEMRRESALLQEQRSPGEEEQRLRHELDTYKILVKRMEESQADIAERSMVLKDLFLRFRPEVDGELHTMVTKLRQEIKKKDELIRSQREELERRKLDAEMQKYEGPGADWNKNDEVVPVR